MMSFIRKIKKGDKIYYAEVVNERIEGKAVQRHIRYIGKDPDALPTRFELGKEELGQLLDMILKNSITPDDIFNVLEKSGKPVSRGKLKKFGIEYDVSKKTYYIFLRYQ
jgi:hypothetical protein